MEKLFATCSECNNVRTMRLALYPCPCILPPLYSREEEQKIIDDLSLFTTYTERNADSDMLIDFIEFYTTKMNKNARSMIKNDFYLYIQRRFCFIQNHRILISRFEYKALEERHNLYKLLYMTPSMAKTIYFPICIGFISCKDKNYEICSNWADSRIFCQSHLRNFKLCRRILEKKILIHLVYICLDYVMQESQSVKEIYADD